MTAKEQLGAIQQKYYYSPELTSLIEKYGEMLLSESVDNGWIDVRPVVKWFAEQMEERLKANDDKTGWLNDDNDELVDRIKEETEELEEEAIKFHKDNKAIIKEAADVANFAMMIADKSGNNFGQHSSPPQSNNEL